MKDKPFMQYQPTIGLEIHSELNTKTKMFCSCRNNPNTEIPNSEICPICLGHPGTLPVINKEAVRKTIKTGLSLNCQIPVYVKFERKNYFYPDLPKGYQISQHDKPFCKNGFLEIDSRKIRIREVHLEEDVGRLVHEKDYSLVNFNRAGIPLMELVTEPDIFSAKEARKFAEELQLILRYLNVSNADMEKGEMRVEANISLLPLSSKFKVPAPKGRGSLNKIGRQSSKLGTKVEIKNLNSFKALEKAIEYEIKRQSEVLDRGEPARNASHSDAGGKVIQETRGWDDVKEVTISQREKEEAHDYRYFPEPDLPSLSISQNLIDEINSEIPELPQQKRKRLKQEYDLLEKEAEVFVRDKHFSEYFEKVMSELSQWLKEKKILVKKKESLKLTRITLNYMLTDLQGLLKRAPHHFFEKSGGGLITPENFAEFITLIYEGKISSRIAKMVLTEMFSTGADPSHIIEERGLVQITDESALEKNVKEVILRNQKAVQDFKKGKSNAFQYLIGQIMLRTQGKANPEMMHRLLKKELSSL